MNGRSMIELAEWRRATAESYATVRREAQGDPESAWKEWVHRRDELFRSHPQSPLDPSDRDGFSGLPYFAYDPAWRFMAPVEGLASEPEAIEVRLPEGVLRYRAVGKVSFRPPGPAPQAVLLLYWLEGYGGGLFLPFGDATNGDPARGGTTYGGGRYLYDGIKGADLGAGPGRIVLDFNFAYNPSCAYSPRWVCPLAPRENRLAFQVRAGERTPPAESGANRSSEASL